MAIGLYRSPRPQQRDFLGSAQQSFQSAGSLYGRMEPERKYKKPGKTVGGGIQSGVGAGLTGMQLQPMISKSLGLNKSVASPTVTAGQAGITSTPVTIGFNEAGTGAAPYAMGAEAGIEGGTAGAAGGAAAGTGAFVGEGVAAGDAALMAGEGATAASTVGGSATVGAEAGTAVGPGYGTAIGAGIGLAVGLAAYYLS